MRVLKEFCERLNDELRHIQTPDLMDKLIDKKIEEFKLEWPGNYEVHHYFEGNYKLVVGVRFKTQEDVTWHQLRWA